MKRGLFFVTLACALALPIQTPAYDRYSVNDDATNCRFCHGDFRASGYISMVDGQNWGNLHNLHRFDMVGGDCDVCHGADTFPVLLDDSDGGTDMESIGCVGCHGRAEDGTGSGTEGYGRATRQRHFRADVGPDNLGLECVNCHADADPANASVVGENVLPPYYANPGTGHEAIPDDPCNANGSENFAGAPDGLDNDGDLASDDADSDCGGQAVTPGETSGAAIQQLFVTSHDPVGSTMGLSYETGCETTDNTIEFGPLDQVSSYLYTGQECGLGTGGSYLWNYSGAPAAMFFVVVGRNDVAEGSYGLDSNLQERPEDTVNNSCDLGQDLTNRCD